MKKWLLFHLVKAKHLNQMDDFDKSQQKQDQKQGHIQLMHWYKNVQTESTEHKNLSTNVNRHRHLPNTQIIHSTRVFHVYSKGLQMKGNIQMIYNVFITIIMVHIAYFKYDSKLWTIN